MRKFYLLFFCFLIATASIFSQSGEYIEFNGIDQYMRIENHEDFNIAASESFTVSFWINVDELITGSNQRFVSKRSLVNNLSDKSGWEVWGANSPSQYVACNMPNAAGNHNDSFSVYANHNGASNVWTHIALTVDRNSGKMYFYVNGSETNQSTNSITAWTVDNPYDVFVGAGINGTYPTQNTEHYFKGKIDELRFYKRALSESEIQTDMNNPISADAEDLVAAYDFENIIGNTVPDITGNHPGVLYNFPEEEGDVVISSADVIQDANYAGRGNANELILKAVLNTSGNDATSIEQIKLSLNGTSNLSGVEMVKVYNTGSNNQFDYRNPSGVLLGEADAATGEITMETTGMLESGINHLWLTFDVSEVAEEGDILDAQFISVTTALETFEFTNGNPDGNREVLLRRTLVFSPGDYGSANYRIPAIITAEDGALVTLTDKRKYNSTDLPEDIDIVASRSTDGGKTWSEPITVALGTGYNNGYGDACLIKTNSGKLVALFVGGVGLWNSTSSNPMHHYQSVSLDNGLTWSEPEDITNQLYGINCPDPVRSNWQASFFGSGRGLAMENGRIMAVIAVREVAGSNNLNNYTVYSDDEGETWQVSDLAITGGDEAKVVELNDGDILMSVRATGNRRWVKSSDGGETWGTDSSWTDILGNACDADIVRYTSTLDGYDKDRLLHTLPNASSRTNVNMWVSYDEGDSWPIQKVLCEGESAYSSITILPDGTIGVYLEEDNSIPYKMYFLNFSLDWLTDGADSYYPSDMEVVEAPVFSPEAGVYDPPQTVSITSATPDAEIYYTLDGSTPNTDTSLYTEPLVLEETCTLKAIAVKEGMANSTVTSASYTIGYSIPGQLEEVGSDRYLTQVSTENGVDNIDYSASEAPESHYIRYTETFVSAKKGEDFTLNLTALDGQEDGLQFCQAIILIDWNRDYKFDGQGEQIAVYGQPQMNNIDSVMDISHLVQVPEDAELGLTRIRVIYTDAWRPNDFEDLGEDPVDKGRMYDFDLEILENMSVETVENEDVFIINPVKNELIISGLKKDYTITLYDLAGKKLFESEVRESRYVISLQSYASDTFLVRFMDKTGKVFTRKVIKK